MAHLWEETKYLSVTEVLENLLFQDCKCNDHCHQNGQTTPSSTTTIYKYLLCQIHNAVLTSASTEGMRLSWFKQLTTYPWMVTHISTNPARRRVTSLKWPTMAQSLCTQISYLPHTKGVVYRHAIEYTNTSMAIQKDLLSIPYTQKQTLKLNTNPYAEP